MAEKPINDILLDIYQKLQFGATDGRQEVAMKELCQLIDILDESAVTLVLEWPPKEEQT